VKLPAGQGDVEPHRGAQKLYLNAGPGHYRRNPLAQESEGGRS
jgi:hypothetical protein